jgi:HK97 family phage prohead protease
MDESSGEIVFEGYAAVFYRKSDPETTYRLADDVVERVARGAFDAALADDPVVALLNHDPGLRLASTKAGTLELSVDGRGLKYRARAGATTLARDTRIQIERGEIPGSSFSFTVEDESVRTEAGVIVRTLKAVRLFDVGPVFDPAYAATSAEAANAERARDVERIRHAARMAEFIDKGPMAG